MTTLSLYKRVKAGDRWEYQRILEGRGHRTNDLPVLSTPGLSSTANNSGKHSRQKPAGPVYNIAFAELRIRDRRALLAQSGHPEHKLLSRVPHAQTTLRCVPIDFRRTERASPVLPQFVGEPCNLFVRVFFFLFFLLVGCQAQSTGLPITSVICSRASNQH
jgi:hypothetical protein